VFPAIASSGVFGLYPISWYTHFVILLSLFTFLFAYYALYGTRLRKRRGYITIESIAEVNYKLLLILCIVIAVWLSSRLLASWETILLSGWGYMRHTYEESFGSSLDLHIHELIAKPLIVATLAIFVVDFIRDSKITIWKILFFLVLLVCLVEETVVFAARAMLVRLVIYVVLTLFLGIYVSKKTKIRTGIALAVIFFFMILITKGRNEGQGDNSVAETFVYYFTASFNLLDYYINHPEFSKLSSDNMTYGACMFGCFYNFIYTAYSVLTGTKYNGSDYIITQISVENAPVSSQVTMNAATTANYPFMMDFGLIGVIVGFALMALLILKLRKLYLKKPSVRNGAFYICTLYSISRLSVSYDYLTISGFLVYFYIWILTSSLGKRKRIVNVKRMSTQG
jgi:oligosaccharide repeat unit polymerase